jgi:hypothetical protein
MAVIPREYSKSDNLRVLADKLSLPISGGVVTFECEQGSGISFFDARSWNGDHLRLDIYQQTPWQEKPVTYQPGAKFKWAFTISYVKAQ